MLTGLFSQVDESNLLYSKLSRMGNYSWGEFGSAMDVPHSKNTQYDDQFGIDPFYINKGNNNVVLQFCYLIWFCENIISVFIHRHLSIGVFPPKIFVICTGQSGVMS